MKLGLVFLSLVALLGWLAFASEPLGARVAAAYVALSPLALALAYLGLGPRLLGKRPDGTLAPWSWALLLPFHLGLGLTLRLAALARGAAFHEVAPGLLLGRRALPRDLPALEAAGVRSVLDLTAELAEPRTLRAKAYLCLPLLDATAPPPEALREALAFIDARLPAGPVYVHCAAGHGRSATVVAAWLIARGLAADARDAEAKLRAVRAGVRLNRAQRAALGES